MAPPGAIFFDVKFKSELVELTEEESGLDQLARVGFIRAEVVSFDDLVDAGSMAEAKSRGQFRVEGKDYVLVDGDVVEFLFNV